VYFSRDEAWHEETTPDPSFLGAVGPAVIFPPLPFCLGPFLPLSLLTLCTSQFIIKKNWRRRGMKVKSYGHAAFKITTDSGVRIIIDPYQSGAFGGALKYEGITDEADIVLTSHDHDDHNYIKGIKGKFVHINKAGNHEAKGVKIKAVPSFHDPSKGNERGNNLLFVIEADGLRIAHMGDLGHTLDKASIGNLGIVDVLLVPVGGFYTIDASEATKVMKDLDPAITIPMHYKTEKCEFPIASVDDFTRGKERVKREGASEVTLTPESLPDKPEIIILDHSL
jgi:L-ascorbate metabolism protein UlaG (beta-lactamase superfamily)